MKVKVIFGSTSGNTENAAGLITAEFTEAELINVVNATAADVEGADLLILGSSTWGIGDLQDDWAGNLEILDSPTLKGAKVALFGLGDQNGFGDSFIDAVGTLYDKVTATGAEVIGRWSVEGYSHTGSTAEADGTFAGLALDEDNESGMTPNRVSAWCKQLREELG